MKDKKEILDFVKDWLSSNVSDELQPDTLRGDSRDLLEKIVVMETEKTE